MKSQLISLLMFAAPLMLQALTSDRTAARESSSPSSPEPAAKEVAAPAPAAKPAPSPAPTCAPCTPAKTSPTPAPASTKPGARVPAKLAPWFM